MSVPTQGERVEHDRAQREYFERTLKDTMVPRATPYLARHVEEALRFAHVSPSDRILEVGCGMGRYTLLLAERGCPVEGLDPSPVLLNRLQEYNHGRFQIPLHCSAIEDATANHTGAFDVILGFFVLHHLHELQKPFAAMATLLKPGGRVVFLEPNPLNILYYLQMLITPGMTWKGDGGIVHMRPHVVFSAMEEAGFKPRALSRFGFLPPFLRNRSWGSRAETFLEAFPPWRTALPFQLFGADRR